MAIRALLYSADAPDAELDIAAISVGSLSARQLLWIDMVSPTAEELVQVSGVLGCASDVLRADADPKGRPGLANYGHCFRLTAKSPSQNDGGRYVAQPLTLVAGPNYVVSVHEAAIDFVDELRNREKGDSTIGTLSSESFTASLLDWLLNAYFQSMESIVREIDKIEVSILGKRITPIMPHVLEVLVKARRQIADLRRMLNSHRDVFYGLARPDFVATEQPESKPHFDALNKRLERAEDDLDHARDLVVGSFELLTMRATQKTNDTMRALTFITVLMGSLALFAGVMGMNFDLAFFKTGLKGFLIVTGTMLLTAGLAIWLAKKRAWI